MSGSLRTKVAFSELPLCVSSYLTTLSQLGSTFPSSCLSLTELLQLHCISFIFVCELPFYVLKNQELVSVAFVKDLCSRDLY